MFKYAGRWLMAMMALVLCMSAASAQQSPRPPAFTQQELDRMLAPIALYPDSLLSQILMAATYPRDVEDAALWSRENADLNGDRAVRAVERYDWDPSVKSLVAFPQILDMMYEKIEWTADIGDAFLDQQAQVMDTVQYLRRQAYAAGNLRSSDQVRVEVRDGAFALDFVSPEYVYVPYYNPVVVYGRWWWPAQPVYWAPWHGYNVRPGYVYAWGPAITVSRGFFYSAPDWRNRRVNIVNVNNYYYRAPTRHRDAPAAVVNGPHVWQHDGSRRRDVPYRAESRPNGPRMQVQATPAPQAAPAPAPQTATAPAAPARVEPSHNGETRRFEQRDNGGRFERRERVEGRPDAGNRPAVRAEAAPAPTPAAPQPQPQVQPQPQMQPRPAPAPQTATAPERHDRGPNTDPRRADNPNRGFERRNEQGRDERRDNNDGRFGNRSSERGASQAAPAAPAAAPAPQIAVQQRPAPAPVPAPAAPVAVQPRPAPMPAPTPPPAAANHPSPPQQAAAPQRGPDNNARRESKRDQGNHQAQNDNGTGNNGSNGRGK